MTKLPIGRPRFVTLEECLAFHEVAIVKYGGSFGVRDQGLLESALAMARQAFGGQFAHEYPFQMAAAYAFHISKNHPFVDGNKRVALMCCGTFLRMNGWNLETEGTASADAILSLIEGRTDKTAFARWIEENSRPRVSMELRDFFASLKYRAIADILGAGLLHGSPEAAHKERVDAMLGAAIAIPAINEANVGAMHAEQAGNANAAEILRGQSSLLTAIFRIAEESGYEW